MGGAFVVVVVTGIQKVGKEKKFQYEKDDEKFYQNNRPQRFARRHGAEPVEIKISTAPKNFPYKDEMRLLCRSCIKFSNDSFYGMGVAKDGR